MGIQRHFDKFHDKIKLGQQDNVYKIARKRDDSITSEIRTSFNNSKYPLTADFIQGSLATKTAIIPINGDYDIDRALVIDYSTAPENPVDPKTNVCDVLERRGFKNARIKKPCVTADYSSEDIHIDFPIYKVSGQHYYLAVGKKNSDESNREWSESDPKGLINWVNDTTLHSDSELKKHSQYRRLVRYLKRWRDHKFSDIVVKKIYSIGLTVMAKECFVPSFNEEGLHQDIVALRRTVEHILDNNYFNSVSQDTYKISVDLPVQPWRDIFHGSSTDTGTQLRNKLIHLKDKLLVAEGLSDVRKQCEIMNQLFGDDFVIPDDPPNGSSNVKKAVYSSAGAVGTSQGA